MVSALSVRMMRILRWKEYLTIGVIDVDAFVSC